MADPVEWNLDHYFGNHDGSRRIDIKLLQTVASLRQTNNDWKIITSESIK